MLRESCLLLITSMICWHFRVKAIIPRFTPGCFFLAESIYTLTDDNTCCLFPTLHISHCEMLLYYHFLSCYTNRHLKHQHLRTLFVSSKSFFFQTTKPGFTELESFLQRNILYKILKDVLDMHELLMVQHSLTGFLQKYSGNLTDDHSSNSVEQTFESKTEFCFCFCLFKLILLSTLI